MRCRNVFQIAIFHSCDSSFSKWYGREPRSLPALLEKQYSEGLHMPPSLQLCIFFLNTQLIRKIYQLFHSLFDLLNHHVAYMHFLQIFYLIEQYIWRQ